MWLLIVIVSMAYPKRLIDRGPCHQGFLGFAIKDHIGGNKNNIGNGKKKHNFRPGLILRNILVQSLSHWNDYKSLYNNNNQDIIIICVP